MSRRNMAATETGPTTPFDEFPTGSTRILAGVRAGPEKAMHVQVRLVDGQGQHDLAGRRAGEVWVKGPAVIPGY